MAVTQKTFFIIVSLLFMAMLGACSGRATPTPGMATITATFDMGGGGAGFAATIYAQEVNSGKTFHAFLPVLT